jgi:putative transposase
MKAIRFKVRPSDEQIRSFNGLRSDLTQVWNLIHRVAMHNRSIEWLEWAEKTSKKDGSWNLHDCSMTAIMLPKRHAYVGATCELIRDGGWWAKDESAIPIAYRGKKIKADKLAKTKEADIWWSKGAAHERLYKFPMTKWMPPKPGKIPRDVANTPFQYIRVPSTLGGGLEIKKFEQLNNAKHLKEFGIRLPPGISHFLCGLFAQFSESYKAWTDPKRPNAHKPRYRQPDDLMRSLYSNQMRYSKLYGCNAARIEFLDRDGVGFIGLNSIFGDVEMFRGELGRLPEGLIPRSYNFTQDASGYYISVVFCTMAEVNNTMAMAQYKRFAGKADDDRKAELKAAVDRAKAELDAEMLNPGNGKTLGIDPGVKRQITAHDGEKTFHIKLSKPRQDKRQRLTRRIDRLKSKLSRIKTANNIRLGADKDLRRSAGSITIEGVTTTLNNEAKLQHRIRRMQLLQANMRRAYQHRVAVRLFRGGYSTIRFEATQVGNMTKRSKVKVKADGKYAKNKAAAKSGLNKSLADTAMAAQSTKVESRFKAAGRMFVAVPAHNTSQLCHCCHVKGDRATQELFLCLNDLCAMVGIPQNADDNASKNIYREPLATDPKNAIESNADLDGEDDADD